ncbi:DUF2911 domain-containing protein [Gaopeijia maritima]|uniref:DUF2911 domain-containing protein n=1 Tax=Gaopeijia maritima TaxID=3119007 RepID=UPI003253829F
MNRIVPSRALLFVALALVAPASATRAQIVASEAASLHQSVSGTDFELLYSRPSLRGRTTIFGGIHPIGESWTGGANDATELRISNDVTMGGVTVPAGAYSVWFDVVEGDAWRMMLHEDTAMFHAPHPPIDEAQILVPVSRETGSEVVETLSWTFENLTWNGATLALAWGTERLRVEVEVDPGITLALSEEEAGRYVGEWRIDDSMSRMSAEQAEEMLADPDASDALRDYARAMRDVPTERVVRIVQDPESGWLFRTDPRFAEVWAAFMMTDPTDERFDLLVRRGDGFFHTAQGVGGELRSYYPDFMSMAEFRFDDDGRAISFEVRNPDDEVTMTGVRVGGEPGK